MHYRPLAFVALALTILACDREAAAQSPAGQAYRVHIVSSFGTEFNDGFFYNADGTLLLTQLGGGTWRGLLTIPFVAALHTAQSTNGRITLNYIAVTFPATGARLRGVGFSNQGETFTLDGTTISFAQAPP